MGYIINSKKSITSPAQILEFLGLIVDTVSMELRLPLDKLKKTRAESRKLAREQITSARSLARLLGKMNATTPVIPPALLFCRHLQMSLTRALEEGSQSYETPVTLSPEGREELMWWDNHVEMEWKITSKDGDQHSDRFRCIPYGMGCNQLSTKDWRSLVS